jgi:hypothetical protein
MPSPLNQAIVAAEKAKRERSFLDLVRELRATFHNNPRNKETVEALFGGAGLAPGVGDVAAAIEAKYRWDQGDKLGAGLAGLGALPLIPNMAHFSPAIMGMVGAKSAKNADIAAMLKALDSQYARVPREQTLKDTGWWKLPTGQWVFEFSDAKSAFRPDIPFRQAKGGQSTALGRLPDLFDHKDLYENYPMLRDYTLSLTVDPRLRDSASYHNKHFTVRGPHETATRDSLLHEIVHAIADIDGLPQGGNTANFSPRIQYLPPGATAGERAAENYVIDQVAQGQSIQGAVQALYRNPQINSPLPAEETLSYLERVERQSPSPAVVSAYQQYKNLHGEALARAVERRSNLPQEWLRDIPFWLFYDVPEAQQYSGVLPHSTDLGINK